MIQSPAIAGFFVGNFSIASVGITPKLKISFSHLHCHCFIFDQQPHNTILNKKNSFKFIIVGQRPCNGDSFVVVLAYNF